MFQHKMQPTAPTISRYLWSWIHHAATSLPRRRFVASTTIGGEENLWGETHGKFGNAGKLVLGADFFLAISVVYSHGVLPYIMENM